MTREEMQKLRPGDVVQSSDGTLVKVHHLDADGRVFYQAYVRFKDVLIGKIQRKPYRRFWGYATDCTLATEAQKAIVEKCIREYERKDR